MARVHTAGFYDDAGFCPGWFAHVARNSRPAGPALLMRPALARPGGRPLRDPAVRDPAALGPEPRRCPIAVVLTTAMPHRCGCSRAPPGDRRDSGGSCAH
jgi:hypothetical protein